MKAASVLLFLALAAAQQPAPAPDVNSLQWLSGHWSLRNARGATIEEHWTSPAGGMLLGVSRTVREGKVRSFEFLRIEQRADGIYYVAQPGGNPPVSFKMTKQSADEVVFENPAHDFPQLIRYQRTSADELTASVEGPPNKDERPQTFAYKRVR